MIVFDNKNHGYIIAEAAGTTFNPVVDRVISRVNAAGDLLGGIIYQGYTGASISMHVASFRPNWINNDLLFVAFHYPFEQLGCCKVIGTVPSRNQQALAFDKKLGFKEEARIRDVFPDGDMIVLSMRKEECRWLRLKPRSLRGPQDGWEELRSTAA